MGCCDVIRYIFYSNSGNIFDELWNTADYRMYYLRCGVLFLNMEIIMVMFVHTVDRYLNYK